MATYNKQTITSAPVAPTYNAAAAGDTIQAPEGAIFHIKNASGVSITCTITATATLANGTTFPNLVITVPAGAERICRLGGEFTNGSGQAALTWSATASVTWAIRTL